ncbi:MAG TPA: aminotransferase class I/II-fold pyridoxal phosphate-dependent enzyme [Planctomycetaceae bacterium]|nr:aminotransferase class I/II-fold pyridoxal phosphate-dependent enzyme [Planctomycetaceae bacterium]
MFEQLQPAPPDAILGLTEAFRKDSRPEKINLTVGVYKDASGKTPILNCVKEAEKRLLETESSKSYLGIDGIPQYGQLVRELLWGPEHEIVTSGRAVTLQTPGGTGATVAAGGLSLRARRVAGFTR